MLWKSPSQQDNALHTTITNSFNYLNYLIKKDKEDEALSLLIDLSECDEVGLGVSKTRKGTKISKKQAQNILNLFKDIPEYSQFGFTHFEIIQLYITGISKDRISDITCNYLKSFLIDYTVEQCELNNIPIEGVILNSIYDYKTNKLVMNQKVYLPVNPKTKEPLIFTPKRWLRFNTWINYEDYFKKYCPRDEIFNPNEPEERVKVLNFNRENYGVVEGYIEYKTKTLENCKNDPLFSQIPVLSARRKLNQILKLNTGKENGADLKYEELSASLLASLFYPHLDFAQTQSRTESGRHIRDLIFYNNRDIDFLDEIFSEYNNRQLVIEMKNVKEISRDHINQLNRYMQDNIGNFGVFLTRNPLSKAMYENTINLWSSQRKCIIAITDEDLKLMVEVYESKQRTPIEVLKKKYIEFRRSCPS
ncbi:MAG: Unknown protein [uncultured Sulfurovum sp.]|uniref:Restriction endonuclease type IV Mrr domain-containing protein n=1 Tax=uncultured Sulfurovum sp. TaxID=269237 RepID=A0A6S6S5V8_9BACT|nr:MAG: Unknown protein [uncultured Sulfurovum sp.]